MKILELFQIFIASLLTFILQNMKTKFIVASSIGLLGLTSMVLWATTFAANTGTNKTGWHGTWTKLMQNRGNMMKTFNSSWDAQAFRTAVNLAMTNNDYTAYVAANTKYNITSYMTQDQFTKIVSERAKQQQSLTALKNWDYASWVALNSGNSILSKIDTEAKFQKLQEIETYREKITSLNTDLGLGELKGEDGNWNKLGLRFDLGKWMGMKWWAHWNIGWMRWWMRNSNQTSQ